MNTNNPDTIKARLTVIKDTKRVLREHHEAGLMSRDLYLSLHRALVTERDTLIIRLGQIRLGFVG